MLHQHLTWMPLEQITYAKYPALCFCVSGNTPHFTVLQFPVIRIRPYLGEKSLTPQTPGSTAGAHGVLIFICVDSVRSWTIVLSEVILSTDRHGYLAEHAEARRGFGISGMEGYGRSIAGTDRFPTWTPRPVNEAYLLTSRSDHEVVALPRGPDRRVTVLRCQTCYTLHGNCIMSYEEPT